MGQVLRKPTSAEAIGLPARPFLFTIDQIATLLSLRTETVFDKYLFYVGRSTGVCPRDVLRAVNIAQQGSKPEWRVSERDFMRWLKVKGFKFYEQAWLE